MFLQNTSATLGSINVGQTFIQAGPNPQFPNVLMIKVLPNQFSGVPAPQAGFSYFAEVATGNLWNGANASAVTI